MHDHAHHGHAAAGRRTRAIITFSAVATLAYVVLAFVVGIEAHSLALLSEAGHNLTDFLALALTWVGVYFQSKPPTPDKSYGYHRAGVLTALANVVTLFVITALIVVEAVGRLRTPETVAAGAMLWVAVIGLVMNAVIAWLLEHGNHDVNIRAAFVHMLGDALAAALVIVAALVIQHTGWMIVDPLLSLAIAGLILLSGWDVLRETLNILLEGTPRGMRPDQVAAALSGVEGVRSVHDLHIWSLGSQAHALSAHVRIADIPPSASESIRARLCALLEERYHIGHATLQFEAGECAGCELGKGSGK